MMNRPVAVVLGLRENGLGVVRALGRQGVPVIAVDDTVDRFYTKTRYARRVVCEDFYGTGLIDRLCKLDPYEKKNRADELSEIVKKLQVRLAGYGDQVRPADELADVPDDILLVLGEDENSGDIPDWLRIAVKEARVGRKMAWREDD